VECRGGYLWRAWILDDHVSGFEGVNVLIADNDRWNRHCAASILSTAGFTVDQASNGMSALRVARDVKPHVVVVAPGLPEIAAAELVGLLRSDPQTRDAALVQLASDEAQPQADAAVRLPYSPIELFTSVVDALAARRARLATSAIAPRRPAGRKPKVATVA
jgi:CheY-like chemotaxis protein